MKINQTPLKAALINARSINNKSCILYDLIVDNSLSLLFITETWIAETDSASIAAFLPGTHDFYHVPREEGRGGGVGLAASRSLQSVKMTAVSFGSFECMEVSIVHQNRKMRFYLIYRPPHGNITSFIAEFDPFLTESLMADHSCIYLGDFNLWMNKLDDSRTVEMINALESHDLKNYIEVPTHISGNTLDLLITDFRSEVFRSISVEPCATISDHKIVFFELQESMDNVIDKEISFRNYKRLDSSKFSGYLKQRFTELKQINVCLHNLNCVECTSCLVHFYREESSSFIDKNLPICTKKIKCSEKSKNKWYNSNPRILDAKRVVRRAEKRLYAHQTEENRTEFIRLRNNKCRLVDEIKKNYYRDQIRDCSNDSRKLQDILNELTGRNLKPYILPAGYDNKTLVMKFKEFFLKKIEDITASLSPQNPSNISHIPEYPLRGFNNFRTVTKDEVSAMLQEINLTNCSNDPYNIKFLNKDDLNRDIVNIFVDIINSSFVSGLFPSSEKCAVVKPLIKANKDKDNFSSYRPLYNTSVLSKLIEHACLLQLQQHLQTFEAIPKYQSAYKKFHSVETALCQIYNELIIRKSAGKHTLLILLDLSAAFDTVNQKILLNELQLLGVGETVLEWFESYLTGRSFYVEIDNVKSNISPMLTGIPQGTKLSPILFSIYTTELYHILANMGYTCHFYADDSQFMINVENIQHARDQLGNIMQTYYYYVKCYLLASIAKCCTVVYKMKKYPCLYYLL